MKVKQDFITNSSSMSFFVKGATTGEILREMVRVHRSEWENTWKTVHEQSEEVLLFLSKNESFDENIIFPWTCNYSTFIFKLGERLVRVETCSNIRWFDKLQNNFSIKMKMDDEEFLSQKRKFLDLTDMKIKTGRRFRMEEWKNLLKKIKKAEEERKTRSMSQEISEGTK